MSVQVSYKKQTALGIIGIIIILLILKGVANIWWTTQINCEFENSETFSGVNEEKKRQLCVDLYEIKKSGYEIIPNQNLDTVNINSHGFRGVEFSEAKSSETYRIFMLGGSTMFGTGTTSDNTTIPGYLQNLFNQNNFEIDIQVINAGIQGADSKTELNLIKNKLLQFSPNMIIIYDGWNDLQANRDANELLENWELICEFGKNNNFDTVISLQPIAGFGNKLLTNQELEYSRTGQDYNGNPLIDLLPVFNEYERNLFKKNSCSPSINLRYVFDTEIQPIFWDQGHVSDKGNEILAKSFYKNIIPIIFKNYTSGFFETKIMPNIENKQSIQIENILRRLISNYKTPVMFTELFSFSRVDIDQDNTVIQEKFIVKTNSMLYDNREIYVVIELIPSNFFESENKKIKIFTYDDTNKKELQNVTYLLSISTENENLIRDYFYVEDKFLILEINSNDSESIIITGEKQYDHNAYVMKSESLSINGPFFNSKGSYNFDIDLRTIDDSSNWIFRLDKFKAEINIQD